MNDLKRQLQADLAEGREIVEANKKTDVVEELLNWKTMTPFASKRAAFEILRLRAKLLGLDKDQNC